MSWIKNERFPWFMVLMGKQPAKPLRHRTVIDMNPLKSLCSLILFLGLGLSLWPNARAADQFRTDINPALLYYQAFAIVPELSQEDRDYLQVKDWRGRPLDGRFEELIAKYDNQFKFVRQAAHARVPCDWGVDLTQGPEALLPGLAKAKGVALTARLRVRWHLEHSRQTEARDDLLAAFVLGRNLSRDGVLISALVQIAMENIVASIVAENYFRFSPETLEQILAGIDAAPPRGTVQQCMEAEKTSFHNWFLKKLAEFQAETPGNDASVVAKARDLFARTLTEGEHPDRALADRVIAAAGGTGAGLELQVKELKPLYDELTGLLGLPFEEYGAPSKAFDEKLARHPNPLVGLLFPAIHKSRAKEFRIDVKLAMVRAAVAYRLRADEGLRAVNDPCGGGGPFRFSRLVIDGQDVGFALKSRLNTLGWDEVLAFAEKETPAFYVDGKNAGRPLPRDPTFE